jgi:hypothetical protein
LGWAIMSPVTYTHDSIIEKTSMKDLPFVWKG